MRLAEEQGLELVEVNPRAAPPVCKIMDFGKFKYETSKKEKASRKHQSTILLKEIKLRPKTDDHDLDFKVKHIRRFLSEGNKCKLVTVFRGREIVHPETGQAMLDTVMKMVADIATVEQRAMMEGRRMVMVIGPKSGVFRPAAPPPPSGTTGTTAAAAPSGPPRVAPPPAAEAPAAPPAAPAKA
jgi:translation initiation factor IF-3